MTLPYTLAKDISPVLGAIVLQSDRSLEHDLRRLLPTDANLLVTRVPSGTEVTPESLSDMAGDLTASAKLFPRGQTFDAVAYGCTSGAAQIGSDRVADLVSEGVTTHKVTDPVSALIAACSVANVSRLGLVSPYIETVSLRLKAVLSEAGIETPAFASFDEPEEARVALISPQSIIDAAIAVSKKSNVDAIFLSCTNLRTLAVLPKLRNDLELPVWSSNLVLAWHLMSATNFACKRPDDLLAFDKKPGAQKAPG